MISLSSSIITLRVYMYTDAAWLLILDVYSTATLRIMQTATVFAAVFFSFAVAVYARETRTATFQPDQPISGRTTLEIVLDTEVRNM